MKIAWSRRAIRHLTGLRSYIEKDSPQNAALVAKRILQAIELAANHPEISRPGRVAGTRELVVDGTPFVIPYRIRGQNLDLLAIFHGRQRWPAKL